MHYVAILERAGLGLVGVDDEIDRLAALAVDESPLHATGETGAAATAQTGFLHLVDELFGLTRDRLLQDFVAAVPNVTTDVIRVAGLIDMLENDAALGGCGHGGKVQRFLASALI
jgi:hypothetical protein